MPVFIRDFVELIFSCGLLFNVLLFIPQAIKVYRQKNSKNLSLITFAGFNIMQFFTAWHGYLEKDYVLMIGFGLSFFTCGIVTILIIRYK